MYTSILIAIVKDLQFLFLFLLLFTMSPPPPPPGPIMHQDEALLDNWIKELESGIKGMAEVAGMAGQKTSLVSLDLPSFTPSLPLSLSLSPSLPSLLFSFPPKT